MNLIEELKNYCEINNPVGALMLSGEWGSGKTYLIKSKFIPSVKDNYVFLSAASRSSLAGRTPWLKRKDAGTLSAVSPSKGCGSTERRFGQRTQPGTYGEGHYFRGQPATGNENL